MSIAQKYYQITAKIPDFVSRNNQLAMVEIIDRCYTNAEQEKICLVEAPTGTGKSFAYLLAGITHALAQQKKFIIATATKTLQSQLYSKDLPKFAKFSQIGFSYGLAKGRTNYLCPYQLELSCSGDVLNDMFNQDENEQRLYKLEEIRRLYAKGNWTGDLDQAPVIIPSKLKPFITSDRYQCIGQQCPYNQKDDCNCPFYLNREKLKNCDVIVTNHSLLLADLELGGGVALPNQPEDYYLCIDEAHNFTNYAINSFTGQFELNHSIETTKQLAKLAENNTTNSYIIPDTELSKSLASSSLIVNDLIIKLLELLKLNPILFKNNLLILNNYLNPHLPPELMESFNQLNIAITELVKSLFVVQEKMREQIREGNDLVEYDLIKLSSYVASIEKIQTTVTYIISQDNSRYNANARWIEYRLNNGKEEYFVNAGVTHVGNLLDEKLWSKVYATCLTSATLAIGDSFEYIKSQLGLSNNSQCKEIKLDTEFNYAEHSQLSIPYFKNSPDFNSREAFEQDLITYLTTILAYTENYGSLVLFFNRQQLLMVYKGLPKAIQAKILLQTDFASNQKLLTTHRELIDEGKPSIIFGLNSFAEGVDLPVQYCMHVIITKLPFETYKDPQNMVREHWVKEENGNYFIEISLPETGIKLIQAVGRLIRSEQDYGQVTICDNRIVLKSYGNFLLNALPKFNRQYDPEFITKALSKMNCTF